MQVLQPEMDSLKRRFFQVDLDEPVVFHRKELVNKRFPFGILWDSEIEAHFNTELLISLLAGSTLLFLLSWIDGRMLSSTKFGIIIPTIIALQ